MRHAAPVLVLVALAGCRSEPARATCDLDALADLGDQLGPLAISEQARQVWPGLAEACGQAIPPPLEEYFEPMHDPKLRRPYLARERGIWTAALQRRACPDWDELNRADQIPWSSDMVATATYERCELARYGVFATEEVVGFSPAIMTWAAHQWLLDQGLDGPDAAPITRALFALEQISWSPIERYDDLRLPRAHGVRFEPAAAAYVTRDSILVEGRPSVKLVDGQFPDSSVVLPLADDLHELGKRFIHEPDPSFVIVADARTPMATIERLFWLVSRDGYGSYGLVVEPHGYLPTQVPVTLARTEPNVADDETIFMRIELAPESMRLSRVGRGGHRPESHALTQLDAVYSYAQAIRSDDPTAHRVVVSAEAAVALEQALAVIEAARGPDCGEAGAGCVLAEVLLLLD